MPNKNVSKVEVEAVRGILSDHVGKDDPITSAEISERLGDLDNHDSNPNTRAIIRTLVWEERVPVAASSQGYYIVESEDELDEYNNTLTQRAEKILDRRDIVTRAFYE